MAPGRAVKRRRVTPPEDENRANSSKKQTSNGDDFYSRASKWNLEQDYETRPRKSKEKQKEQTRLPIRTTEGVLQQLEEEEAEDVADDDSFLGTDDDEEDGDGVEEDGDEEEEEEQEPELPIRQQILNAKEEMARLAMLINEDPEEHAGSFKKLTEMTTSAKNPTIKKLAMATQAAVYKDMIPGYRIRPLKEEELGTKISKEVRRLRNFEQSLLSGYQHYVNYLASTVKRGKGHTNDDKAGLKTVAITCVCTLLTSVPHFNLRTELLKILIEQLARRKVDDDFNKAREALETLFVQDEDGNASLEAVGLLASTMRKKDFHVNEAALNTFLYLRLLSEFSSKGSNSRTDKAEDDSAPKKIPKKQWEHRSKKQRKIEKERKVVEKDMREADATVAHEQREKNQSETLKLVFTTYFRILKARTPHLMGAVLEGLARYAHLINQDFFGDVLEALKDLIQQAEEADGQGEEDNEDAADTFNGVDSDDEDDALPTAPTRDHMREILLCTITAFALLSGQDASKAGSTLSLDLSFFVTHLYRILYAVAINADIEYNPNSTDSKTLRLPDPNAPAPEAPSTSTSKNRINLLTPTVLLLRSLQPLLLPPNHSPPSAMRLAAFTKRLLTTSLHTPEKSTLATLALLQRVGSRHGSKIERLWNTEERKGDGVFEPLAGEVERSNVFAGGIWEGEMLRLHYCPKVRENAISLEKMMGEDRAKNDGSKARK